MMTHQGGEINHKDMEKSVVWPCMVVVANIHDVQYKDDRCDVGKKLKDELVKQGYNPIKVDLLGHSGFGVVEFGKELDGFGYAKNFLKDFEVKKHGRKDWYDETRGKDDDNLYAWSAIDEDYKCNGLVGDYLRKHGYLKSASEVFKEVQVKFMELETEFEETTKRSEEFQKEMMIEDFDMMIEEFDTMIENYNEEHAMMQEKVNEQRKKISTDNEKKMNEWVVLEHKKKVDDTMLKLADDQKREKEIFQEKMMEIQKKLDVKQQLELEVNRMKGELEVMKHMTDEDDVEAKELGALNESEQMKELGVLEHKKKVDDTMLKLDDKQKVLKE